MTEIFFALLVPGLVLGSIVLAIVVAGRRVAESQRRDPLDPAQIVLSAAIFVTLFVSFLVVSQGLIELAQGFVDLNRSIDDSAGSLAGPLSLLIVGAPAFGGLLFAVESRHRRRVAEGDTRAMRGWSVYLVASLTASLTSALIGVAMLIDDVAAQSRDVDGRAFVAPVLWSGIWALHWFALRPRYGVRGDVHLAYGSFVGLLWLATGVSQIVFGVLDRAYGRLFLDVLDETQRLLPSVLVLVTGLAVWAWHWLLHFNRPAGGWDGVEGERRRSTLWFVVAVLAGALPGAVASLGALAESVRALLLWPFDPQSASGAEFFSDLPAILTVLFVGLGSWAYHHRQIQRGPRERNEPLRFRDYVLSLAGLGIATYGIASLLVMALRLLFGDGVGLSRFTLYDRLVTTLVVLGAGLALWWFSWRNAERSRALDPLGEVDSFWRKVFMVVGLAIGGLTLGLAVINLLFELLRQLLDAPNAGGFASALGPFAWAVSVGLVTWLVFDFWRADRRLLAGASPAASIALPARPTSPLRRSATPPEPSGVRAAGPGDDGQVFTLTRAALAGRPVPDGTTLETFEQWRLRQQGATTHVFVEGSRVVGAVTARPDARGVGVVEAVVVAPDRSDTDIGRRLLAAAEQSERQQSERQQSERQQSERE